GEAVGQSAVLERAAQIPNGVLDASARAEAEPGGDLVRIDVVGADVVGGGGDDLDRAPFRELLLDDRPHDLCDVHHRVVLVADVERLAGDRLVGHSEQELVEVAHVLDVQVRTELLAAEDRDLAGVHRVVGQDVDGEVETHPRAVAANGRGPYRD